MALLGTVHLPSYFLALQFDNKVQCEVNNGYVVQTFPFQKGCEIVQLLIFSFAISILEGNYYDKTHVIVNQPLEGEETQKWDIEIL